MPGTENGTKRRRRVVKHKGHNGVACAGCTKAKRKCDGQRPCSRCIEQNIECLPGPAELKRLQRMQHTNEKNSSKQETEVGMQKPSTRQKSHRNKVLSMSPISDTSLEQTNQTNSIKRPQSLRQSSRANKRRVVQTDNFSPELMNPTMLPDQMSGKSPISSDDRSTISGEAISFSPYIPSGASNQSSRGSISSGDNVSDVVFSGNGPSNSQFTSLDDSIKKTEISNSYCIPPQSCPPNVQNATTTQLSEADMNLSQDSTVLLKQSQDGYSPAIRMHDWSAPSMGSSSGVPFQRIASSSFMATASNPSMQQQYQELRIRASPSVHLAPDSPGVSLGFTPTVTPGCQPASCVAATECTGPTTVSQQTCVSQTCDKLCSNQLDDFDRRSFGSVDSITRGPALGLFSNSGLNSPSEWSSLDGRHSVDTLASAFDSDSFAPNSPVVFQTTSGYSSSTNGSVVSMNADEHPSPKYSSEMTSVELSAPLRPIGVGATLDTLADAITSLQRNLHGMISMCRFPIPTADDVVGDLFGDSSRKPCMSYVRHDSEYSRWRLTYSAGTCFAPEGSTRNLFAALPMNCFIDDHRVAAASSAITKEAMSISAKFKAHDVTAEAHQAASCGSDLDVAPLLEFYPRMLEILKQLVQVTPNDSSKLSLCALKKDSKKSLICRPPPQYAGIDADPRYDDLAEGFLSSLPIPVIRAIYHPCSCLPISLMVNEAATRLFGFDMNHTLDVIRTKQELHLTHPDTALRRALLTIDARNKRCDQYSFQGAYLRTMSMEDMQTACAKAGIAPFASVDGKPVVLKPFHATEHIFIDRFSSGATRSCTSIFTNVSLDSGHVLNDPRECDVGRCLRETLLQSYNLFPEMRACMRRFNTQDPKQAFVQMVVQDGIDLSLREPFRDLMMHDRQANIILVRTLLDRLRRLGVPETVLGDGSLVYLPFPCPHISRAITCMSKDPGLLKMIEEGTISHEDKKKRCEELLAEEEQPQPIQFPSFGFRVGNVIIKSIRGSCENNRDAEASRYERAQSKQTFIQTSVDSSSFANSSSSEDLACRNRSESLTNCSISTTASSQTDTRCLHLPVGKEKCGSEPYQSSSTTCSSRRSDNNNNNIGQTDLGTTSSSSSSSGNLDHTESATTTSIPNSHKFSQNECVHPLAQQQMDHSNTVDFTSKEDLQCMSLPSKVPLDTHDQVSAQLETTNTLRIQIGDLSALPATCPDNTTPLSLDSWSFSESSVTRNE